MKSTLRVYRGASVAVENWQLAISIISWILLAIGIIMTVFGLISIGQYDWKPITLYVGIAAIVSSISCFLIAVLLRGFQRIVECAEYNKAKIEEEYAVIENGYEKKESSEDSIIFDGKFAINQLVINKKTEEQFRISAIKDVNGVTEYYSKKFNASFKGDEIMDFKTYWEKKKG